MSHRSNIDRFANLACRLIDGSADCHPIVFYALRKVALFPEPSPVSFSSLILFVLPYLFSLVC
jgi:hypothetical protein